MYIRGMKVLFYSLAFVTFGVVGLAVAILGSGLSWKSEASIPYNARKGAFIPYAPYIDPYKAREDSIKQVAEREKWKAEREKRNLPPPREPFKSKEECYEAIEEFQRKCWHVNDYNSPKCLVEVYCDDRGCC